MQKTEIDWEDERMFKNSWPGACVFGGQAPQEEDLSLPKTRLRFFMRFTELFHLRRSERGPTCVGVHDASLWKHVAAFYGYKSEKTHQGRHGCGDNQISRQRGWEASKWDGDSHTTLWFTALWSAGIQRLPSEAQIHEWLYFGSRTDTHSQICQPFLWSQGVIPAETAGVSAPGGLSDVHRHRPLWSLCIYAFDRHPHKCLWTHTSVLVAVVLISRSICTRLEITTSLAHISMSLLTFPQCPMVPVHVCVCVYARARVWKRAANLEDVRI